MKSGVQERKKVIWLAVLLLLAGWMLWRQFASGPQPNAAAPAVSDPTAALPSLSQIMTHLQLNKLEQLQKIQYKGSRRDLFVAGPEAMTRLRAPRPLPSPATRPASMPMQPPSPPPIPVKYYGFARRPDGPQRVFLEYGGKVFIAGDGDRIAGRYQVLSISPSTVQVRDLVSQQTQFLPLMQL